jgi:uncharacterized membrane protein
LEQQIKDMSIRFMEEKNTHAEQSKELTAALEAANASKEELSEKLQQAQAVSHSIGFFICSCALLFCLCAVVNCFIWAALLSHII